MAPVDTNSSTHPLAPPTQEEDLVAWLRLIRSRRVGVATFFRLLAEHGSAQAALKALPGVAQAAGVENYRPFGEKAARAELRRGSELGARLIAFGSPGYPTRLSEIADPPPLLWALGNTGLLHRPSVAMVGARNASSLGTRMARKLASDLGQDGFCIVSGLARGIDTAAHLAALEGGTIAVLAGGLDHIYPAENTKLADDIAKSGLLLSEQPFGLQPRAAHFPRRNRLISGLSRAVVVVEAAARSGSLITAGDALDQGRDVLAVPGHPFDARASGCNQLIRDGALLVRGAADVLSVIAEPVVAAPKPQRHHSPAKPELAETPRLPLGPETQSLHAEILSNLGPSPIAEDQLIRDLGVPADSVAPVLLTLELDGQLVRQPGGLIARVP